MVTMFATEQQPKQSRKKGSKNRSAKKVAKVAPKEADSVTTKPASAEDSTKPSTTVTTTTTTRKTTSVVATEKPVDNSSARSPSLASSVTAKSKSGRNRPFVYASPQDLPSGRPTTGIDASGLNKAVLLAQNVKITEIVRPDGRSAAATTAATSAVNAANSSHNNNASPEKSRFNAAERETLLAALSKNGNQRDAATPPLSPIMNPVGASKAAMAGSHTGRSPPTPPHDDYTSERGHRHYYMTSDTVPQTTVKDLSNLEANARKRAEERIAARLGEDVTISSGTQKQIEGAGRAALAHVEKEKETNGKDRSEMLKEQIKVYQLAQRNVSGQLGKMDKEIASNNIFSNKQYNSIAIAIAEKEYKDRHDATAGKIDLGGGAYMTQEELNAIAQQHVQPVLDSLTEKAIANREHDEEVRQEKERVKAEKARTKAEKSEEKARIKAEKAEEKARVKAQKAEEKAKRKSEKEHQKEIKAKDKDKKHEHRKFFSRQHKKSSETAGSESRRTSDNDRSSALTEDVTEEPPVLSAPEQVSSNLDIAGPDDASHLKDMPDNATSMSAPGAFAGTTALDPITSRTESPYKLNDYPSTSLASKDELPTSAAAGTTETTETTETTKTTKTTETVPANVETPLPATPNITSADVADTYDDAGTKDVSEKHLDSSHGVSTDNTESATKHENADIPDSVNTDAVSETKDVSTKSLSSAHGVPVENTENVNTKHESTEIPDGANTVTESDRYKDHTLGSSSTVETSSTIADMNAPRAVKSLIIDSPKTELANPNDSHEIA
ncbi:hypothetical protein V1511DRAFT_504693 [Dipodascopsis uninucleata]